jgi:hypothetical protein
VIGVYVDASEWIRRDAVLGKKLRMGAGKVEEGFRVDAHVDLLREGLMMCLLMVTRQLGLGAGPPRPGKALELGQHYLDGGSKHVPIVMVDAAGGP